MGIKTFKTRSAAANFIVKKFKEGFMNIRDYRNLQGDWVVEWRKH